MSCCGTRTTTGPLLPLLRPWLLLNLLLVVLHLAHSTDRVQ
jgi:hypothetical protein